MKRAPLSTQERLDEVRVTDLLAVPERHGGDLRVEKRVRDLAGQVMDDFEVLAARMKDLQDLLILDEQVEEGLHVDPLRLGIDRGGLFAARDLDQGEVGPIGVLAHELRVHCDERVLGETVDQRFEVVRLGNQRMNIHESGRCHSSVPAG